MEMTRLWTSKAVSEIGYDADSRTLRLVFRSGGRYDYLDVDPEVYQGLDPLRPPADRMARAGAAARLPPAGLRRTIAPPVGGAIDVGTAQLGPRPDQL